MNRRYLNTFLLIAAAMTAPQLAWAQTSLAGSALALKSTGSATMTKNGYVGTYLVVPSGGATVNFTINANESANGTAPHLNLSVANTNLGFSVANAAASNYTTSNVTLPAGTYLVAAQRDYAGNVGVTTGLAVNNFSVNTVSGTAATFSNTSNAANAMAAANSYINHFRQGNLKLNLNGAVAGTAAEIKLVNSAFKLGTTAPDSLSTYFPSNVASGSTAAKFQQLLKDNFNSVTPENGGKWASDSTGSNVDGLLDFASKNGIRVRMHNAIWGSQQPTSVNSQFTAYTAAAAGSAAQTAAQQNIVSAVNTRLAQTITGTNSRTTAATARAQQFAEYDVYNESYHTGEGTTTLSGTNQNYWQVLNSSNNAAGIAAVYNTAAANVQAAGSTTKVFTNEYNVLNNGPDNYGQWYTTHVEEIRAAGGRVDGIGSEWYNGALGGAYVGTGSSQMNPARAYQSLANLAVGGVATEITEFGLAAGGTDAPTALTDAMTLAFGSPSTTGFTVWDAYNNGSVYSGSAGSVLFNQDFTPTAAGLAYQSLRSQWTTDLNTVVAADGSITLPSGYYGDYQLLIDGHTYSFTFDNSVNEISLAVVPEPTSIGLLSVVGIAVMSRRRQ